MHATQREVPGLIKAERRRYFEICGDEKRIPTGVDRLIYVWRLPLQASGVHFLFGRLEKLSYPLGRDFQTRGDLVDRRPLVKYILCRIVVHLTDFIDVVVQTGNLEFLFVQN